MRIHTSVIVFVIIWFVGVGIGSLAVLASLLSDQSFEPTALIPFGMLIFGYALVTGAFKYESIKSKKFLASLFEAEIVK